MLPKEDYFSQALYTFDIGQNDLTAGYKLNMTIQQVKAYVPDVLGQFSNGIKVQLFPFLFILVLLLSSPHVIKYNSMIEIVYFLNYYVTIISLKHRSYRKLFSHLK